jgi:hypothetical protein
VYKNPQVIEFGEIETNSLSTHKIAVFNSSFASESCTLSASTDLDILELSPTSIELAPGENDTVEATISYTTEILGVQGKIYFKNPQDQTVVSVNVSGSILGFPELIVDQTFLDFGVFEADTTDTTSLTLTFSNPGNGRLDQAVLEKSPTTAAFQFSSEDERFDQQLRQFYLPYGEDIEIDVLMICSGDSASNATDLIVWSTEIEDSLFIPLTGECR